MKTIAFELSSTDCSATDVTGQIGWDDYKHMALFDTEQESTIAIIEVAEWTDQVHTQLLKELVTNNLLACNDALSGILVSWGPCGADYQGMATDEWELLLPIVDEMFELGNGNIQPTAGELITKSVTY